MDYLQVDNFNGLPTSVIPGTFNNTDLKPEMTSGFETGLELHFLQKRISFDIAYSSTRSKDVIFNVQQSGASGIDFKIYNAAEITNKTVELMIGLVPVKLKNGFEWGVGMNWAKTNNEVVKLFTDELGNETESVQIGTAPFSATLQMRKGMAASQIVGYDFVYDDKGNKVVDADGFKVVDADGFYMRSETVKPLGSVLPDYTGGFNTYVTFKGIRLAGLIDFQKGGKVFSLTNVWGKYSGIFAETAEGDIRENGLINEGVTETGEQNTTVIAAVDHYFQDGGYVITAADVYDASFVKLREITLSYSLNFVRLHCLMNCHSHYSKKQYVVCQLVFTVVTLPSFTKTYQTLTLKQVCQAATFKDLKVVSYQLQEFLVLT